MKEIIIWHNKTCSTSRKAVELLQGHSKSLQIREYLKNPPSIAEITDVLHMMGQEPSYILRKKDKVFQECFAGKNLSDQEWISAMSQNPSIIERPIVIIGNKAYLARLFDAFANWFAQLK
jgi:arsenate reductase